LQFNNLPAAKLFVNSQPIGFKLLASAFGSEQHVSSNRQTCRLIDGKFNKHLRTFEKFATINQVSSVD